MSSIQLSSASMEAKQAFDEILPVIFKEFENFPDSKEMIEKLSQKFVATFNNPPVTDFEIFCAKRFTEDEVRIALFRPLPEQIGYYAKGLLAGLNAPKDHPLRKTASILLTLVYLAHRKSAAFMKEFMVTDGIESLIEYLNNDNLYERSQAMETLVTLIDCDFYDWFASPNSYQDQQIHLKLISILSSVTDKHENYFISQLIANRQVSYPGGSFRALQLIAFWLSWIRALYTKDQKLVLSSKLLEEIRLWSLSSNGDEGRTEGEKADMEEEKKLAVTLYEDFGKTQFENRAESSSSEPKSHEKEPSELGFALSGIQKPNFTLESTSLPSSLSVPVDPAQAAATQPETESPSKSSQLEVTSSIKVILKYKQEGNDFYKSEKYDLALKSYQSAINLLKNMPTSIEDTETHLITLYTNIANTLWKSWEQRQSEQEMTENDHFFQLIQENCANVFQFNPLHIKANYRLFHAMIKMKQYQPAFHAITQLIMKLQAKEKRIQQQSKNSTGSSEFLNDLELFERLKRKCLASHLLESSTISLENSLSQWELTEKDLVLLKCLMKRLQVSETIIQKIQASFPSSSSSSSSSRQGLKEEKKQIKTISTELERIQLEKELQQQQHDNDDDASYFTNQDLSIEVSKPSKPSSTTIKTQVKIKKIQSADRKLIQKLKTITSTFFQLYEKNPSDFLEEEKERTAQQAFEVIKELWSKELKLKDIYGSLFEEKDLFFLLGLFLIATNSFSIVKSLTGGKEWISTSEVFKLLEQILKCERIQSLIFLMKLEFQDLFIQLKKKLELILHEHSNVSENVGVMKGNQKLLNQLLVLIS